MTATDRTAYPRLDERMLRAELEASFTLSESEHAFVAAHARGNVNRLAFAILMKARQAYGLFVNPDALSKTIVAHIAKQLALQVPSLFVTSRLGLHRYRSSIRAYIGGALYDKARRSWSLLRQPKPLRP